MATNREKRNARNSPLVLTMVSLLLITIAAAPAPAPKLQCGYFAETGHYICEEFLQFYEQRGGTEIFGLPLTEAFEDPRNQGMKVQYFQRARMEWHPYNPDPYKVQLGLLVDELGYHFPSARPDQIPAFNNSLYHYFPETGHVVSYAFLNYFREKGGVDIFGYPRSEFMYEDGHIVQYFQRARMEWHPEVASGPQMRLTNLGEVYIERFGIPGDYEEPRPAPAKPDNGPQATPRAEVAELRVSASVRRVITGRQGQQTVFVYVTNRQRRPVQGAAVTMAVHYQSADQHYEFEPTNEQGFTQQSFEILSSWPGQKVVIDVIATQGNRNGKTQTFFLPWW